MKLFSLLNNDIKINLTLDPKDIIGTIARLKSRINDRFPDSKLEQTCNGFLDIAKHSTENIELIARPIYPIRIFTLLIISMGIVGIIYSFTIVEFSFSSLNFVDVVTLAEATINDVVLLGAAIFFLVSLEIRLKRSKALKVLEQLRGIAHVIDMHQLTKDPVMINISAFSTDNSPKRVLTKFELQRYLDYCSEMLSLIGKVAALYAQNLPDDVITGSVNEIEGLTSGLSRKIWQKIIILTDNNDKSFERR